MWVTWTSTSTMSGGSIFATSLQSSATTTTITEATFPSIQSSAFAPNLPAISAPTLSPAAVDAGLDAAVAPPQPLYAWNQSPGQIAIQSPQFTGSLATGVSILAPPSVTPVGPQLGAVAWVQPISPVLSLVSVGPGDAGVQQNLALHLPALQRAAMTQFPVDQASGAIIVWADIPAGGSSIDLFGSRIDVNGNLLDAPGFPLATDPAADEVNPALAVSGNAALLVYNHYDLTSGALRVRARLVSAVNATQATGQPCTVNGDCTNGFCVDLVCCASACNGADPERCTSCSVATGSTADGTCTNVGNRVCRPRSGDCDTAGVCTGSSPTCPADTPAPNGTLCAGGLCQAGMCIGADGGLFTLDAGLLDAGEDAGIDAATDAGVDAAVDAGMEAGVADAGHDSGIADSGTDAGSPVDAGSDAPVIVVADASPPPVASADASFTPFPATSTTGCSCRSAEEPSGGAAAGLSFAAASALVLARRRRKAATSGR